MQSPIEYDIMFPVRMNSELKPEGKAVAKLLDMNFHSSFDSRYDATSLSH
jgi:hypothetical protein